MAVYKPKIATRTPEFAAFPLPPRPAPRLWANYMIHIVFSHGT